MKIYLAKRKINKVLRPGVRSFYVLIKKKNPKIFCIGRNKTGTTSLKTAFEKWGFLVGDQVKAEILMHYYHKSYFDPIIEYCQSARFFQDVPFSLPDTYRYLDEVFPDALFILTIRDSSEQYFSSIRNFAIKRYGKVPTLLDKKLSTYVHSGWEYENHLNFCKRFKLNPELTLDDEEMKAALIKDYENHNKNIVNYFKNRDEKLLVLNVAEKNAYNKLCNFLKRPTDGKDFPWVNRT